MSGGVRLVGVRSDEWHRVSRADGRGGRTRVRVRRVDRLGAWGSVC
jgi:hypothetical protein